MKRVFKILVFVLVIAFIAIQFFQPEKNQAEISTSDFFAQIHNIPADLKETLDYSCYDCHSNNTRYPWYSRIAPLSWMISEHVIEGKAELNFSEWGDLAKRKKISALNDICEVVEDKEMPLESYLKMHKDAALSDEQIKALCIWVETETERLINEE